MVKKEDLLKFQKEARFEHKREHLEEQAIDERTVVFFTRKSHHITAITDFKVHIGG